MIDRLCESKKNVSNSYLPISIIAHALVIAALFAGTFFADKAILAADGDNSIKAVMIDLSMVAAPEQSLVEDSPQVETVEPSPHVEADTPVIMPSEDTISDVVPDIIVDPEVIEKLQPVEVTQLVIAEKPVKKEQNTVVQVKNVPRPQVKQEAVADKLSATAVAPEISTNTKAANDASPISRDYPEYPRKALDMRIEGHVVVLYDISANGRVENIRIIEAKPNSIFNRAVIQAMKNWRYKPVVAKNLTIKIVFNRNKSINFDNAP